MAGDAAAARKAGNSKLVAGDAEGAYAAYTEGLRHSPNDHLLLGNRAEALLGLRRPEEALADADAAIAAAAASGGWAKGYLRKANAEVALRRTRDAIRSLRVGMRLLGPKDPRQAWLDRLASVKELHFQVRVASAAGMGRVLVSTHDFGLGDRVFAEHPLMQWSRRGLDKEEGDAGGAAAAAAAGHGAADRAVTQECPQPPAPPADVFREAGDADAAALAAVGEAVKKAAPSSAEDKSDGDQAGAVPADIDSACRRNGMNASFALILDAFLELGKEERDVVLGCVAPACPLSPPVVAMTGAARDLADIDRFRDLGQLTILRLLMVAKVNAHRIKFHDAGIYETASKMAHSCSPNSLYDGDNCCFIAQKPIQAGDLVTFSYFAGHFLVHSASVRQTILRQTHLFVCKCERCLGVDRTRGIRCDCTKGMVGADAVTDTAVRFRTGTRLLDQERGVYDARAWSCEACGGRWTDEEMQTLLRREDSIEKEADALDKLRDKDVEKGQYERLKELTERSLQYLSRDHWCYLRCVMLLAVYHLRLARRSRGSAVELLQLCILWGRKYAQGLERCGVAAASPMVIAEWYFWLAKACGEWPHLMQARVEFIAKCAPIYKHVYPGDSATADLERLERQAQRTLSGFRNKTFLGKAYRAVSYEYDESELFQRWENHLADRYVGAMRQTPGMSIQRILTEESLPLDPVTRGGADAAEGTEAP